MDKIEEVQAGDNCLDCACFSLEVEYDPGYAYWSGRVEPECVFHGVIWDCTLDPIKGAPAIARPNRMKCGRWEPKA